jgi:hypothetical protein
MNALPGQLELATVIDHRPRPIRAKELGITYEAFCASSGRQLAKMLMRYEDSPSSDLWRDIKALCGEILKP